MGAGDPSGDLLSSILLGAARARLPSFRFWGYGGPHLEAAGVRLVDRIERFGTSGLVEAASRLPRNAALLARVAGALERRPPAVGVLVDYPDLHFLVGPALRRAGSRVVYLLPPQVWAWRPGRIDLMRSFVDAVAACFPFEPALYRSAGMRAEFVGHPLCMLDPYRRAPAASPTGPPVIAFLPGSRRHEVASVLPAMAGAARMLRARLGDVVCRLAPGPTVERSILSRILGPSRLDGFDLVSPPPAGAPTTMAAVALEGASAAVVHAGTATLEAALASVPSIVVARLGRLSWAVARRLVRVRHVALPSIVLGREVFTERLQGEVEPETIARDVERLLGDFATLGRVAAASQELRAMLRRPDGVEVFSDLVLE